MREKEFPISLYIPNYNEKGNRFQKRTHGVPCTGSVVVVFAFTTHIYIKKENINLYFPSSIGFNNPLYFYTNSRLLDPCFKTGDTNSFIQND